MNSLNDDNAVINTAEATRALLRSADQGLWENAAEAVKRGADVRALGVDGRTALMMMASDSSCPSLAFLIQGSDVNAQDEDGWTAMMWATHFGPDEQFIAELLAAGASAKIVDQDGCSPLMAAAQTGSTRAVKLLAPHSDVEARNHKGCTAATLANDQGFKFAFEYLREFSLAQKEAAALDSCALRPVEGEKRLSL